MIEKLILYLLVGIIFTNCNPSKKETVNNLPKQKPNILLISIDDQNDWIGYLNGHPQIKTPNIDKLASEGVAFTDAHCSTPLCTPSRSAIISGKHSYKTGVYDNTGEKLDYLDPSLMPHFFKKNGYRTYGTGKIMHFKEELWEESWFPQQRWSPFKNEKDVLYTNKSLKTKGTETQSNIVIGSDGKEYDLPLHGMPSDRQKDKKIGDSFDWHGFDLEDNAFGDGQIVEWAAKKINEKSEKPFFLGVGFYRPHIPLYAPKKYFDEYPIEELILPETIANDLEDLDSAAKDVAAEIFSGGKHSTILKYQQWEKAVQAYMGCTSFVDTQIGYLIKELKNSGKLDNTIIVLFSDHGYHLGEKEHWGKFTGWKESTHVPFIIIDPASKNKGLCNETVSLLDIYPTLIELTGLQNSEIIFDGESLTSFIENPIKKTERVVLTSFRKGNYAVTSTEWKMIRYKDGSTELYNRLDDKNEWYNLANQTRYKDIIISLEKQLPKHEK